ncbi:MAG: hypothetical protein ACOWWM_20930 [Desulfobacterales bacterium]
MSYYISMRSYRFDPRYLDTPKIDLGDGVDLQDPMRPAKSTYSAFIPEGAGPLKTGALASGVIKSQDIVNETVSVKESLTAKEEGEVLGQYFKASYGLASVNQSYEAASREQSSYHTLYALMEHAGEAARLSSQEVHWERDPESELEGDPARDKALFLARYGSHYVDAIKYGLRIGIQAKASKASTQDSSVLSAAFKAAYGGFNVDAGARVEHQNTLNNAKAEILFEATSGGRSDGGLVVVRDFVGINKLLDDINAGNVKFAVAPIEVILKPYWPTLRREWKKVRSILDPNEKQFEVPAANFGVPRGTILPWYPSGEFIQGLEPESKEVEIVAPDGWAICNGQMGTPNLTDRFVRGTDRFADMGHPGGALTHHHGGQTGQPSSTQGIHSGSGNKHAMPVQGHTHPIGESGNLPPFVWVVYIMKL